MLGIIGLVVCGILLLGAFKGFARHKLAEIRRTKRKYEEAKEAAMAVLSKGEFRLPSWMGDKYKVDSFLKMLGHELVSKGIPESDLKKIADDDYFKGGAMTSAEAFETRGFSFSAQIVGSSDFMEFALEKGLGRKIIANKASLPDQTECPTKETSEAERDKYA